MLLYKHMYSMCQDFLRAGRFIRPVLDLRGTGGTSPPARAWGALAFKRRMTEQDKKDLAAARLVEEALGFSLGAKNQPPTVRPCTGGW